MEMFYIINHLSYDGRIENSAAARRQVVEAIRRLRPRLILAPNRSPPPDHRRAHELARDAAFFANVAARGCGRALARGRAGIFSRQFSPGGRGPRGLGRGCERDVRGQAGGLARLQDPVPGQRRRRRRSARDLHRLIGFLGGKREIVAVAGSGAATMAEHGEPFLGPPASAAHSLVRLLHNAKA